MKREALTIRKLAVENLRQRPYRTLGLIVIAALVAFVIFAGAVVALSMKNGLESMKDRLGADLMIVPLGYDEGVEGILLKGEPTYFYFDKSYLDKVRQVEGVERASAQFFLTSLNQDCCDIPVQFIGFDPDTDFSIKPWISEVYSENIKSGELIVGHDIEADEENQLKFFDKKYSVAARLEETGTGLDQAVYANMDTLMQLFESAKGSGLQFIDDIDPNESLSTILIKTKEGYDSDTVTHNIRSSLDGIQVIKTKSMISGIAESLEIFSSFIEYFALIFVIIALLMMIVVFSSIANERKKEFAILSTIGASGKSQSKLLLYEAAVIGAIGGTLGIIGAAVIVFSFSTYIADSLALPYLQPGFGEMLLIIILSFIISLSLGPLANLLTVERLNRREVYLLLKEGE